MTKLKSADHVVAINAILSADSWLADYVWVDFYSTMEDADEILLPDRTYRSHGGFLVTECGRRDWVKNGKMVYPTRADWAKQEKKYHGPFAKSWFTRNSKKTINGYAVREFSTPYTFIQALTYEKDGVIEKIEFITYKGKNVVRTENLI